MAIEYQIDQYVYQHTGSRQYTIDGMVVQENISTAPPSTSIDFFNPPLTGGTNSMQGNFQG